MLKSNAEFSLCIGEFLKNINGMSLPIKSEAVFFLLLLELHQASRYLSLCFVSLLH